MLKHFLTFEKNIADLEGKIEELRHLSSNSNLNIAEEIGKLQKRVVDELSTTYSNLDPWQKVQVSRHPERPQFQDVLSKLIQDYVPLSGDRNYAEDNTLTGGIGLFRGKSVVLIGIDKGKDTKDRIYRNFGMANPEGYRKALRLMKLAEKFNKPVITLIDTPGAFPGLEAEQRGQGEAIARNIIEMTRLKTPIICVIIGEGASGGALGIGVGDHVLMLNNSWYSVISPENCSTILWRSWDFKEKAADALKLTAKDMKKNKLVDKIIKEPLAGAHSEPEKTFNLVKKEILSSLYELQKLSIDKLVKKRMDKFCNMGIVK